MTEKKGYELLSSLLNCMSILHKTFVLILLMFIWFFTGQCAKPDSEKILFDFESDSEIDRFQWQCHTLFSLSDEHATRGEKSLKLELFPSDYPGLRPKLASNDWQGYSSFSFDVYNTQNTDIPLTVNIDDIKDYPDYSDCYNKTFHLQPGANTVSIPMYTLVTSDTKRNLDPQTICRVLIFAAKPGKRVVLYFDYFRLKP
jgi:hypothetical protein